MAVTLYSSTDVSAPTLNGLADTLINVLDACLVNGYGSKLSAGWTKPFSGTNKAAYRPSAGNRFYLRVLDNNAYNDTAEYSNTSFARITGYETMSDVDTGKGLFPTIAQVGSPGLSVVKTDNRNSTVKPWYVIANDRFFYFISIFDGSWAIMFCFGDFISLFAGDTFNTLINAVPGNLRRNYFHYNNVPGGVQTGLYVTRRVDQLGESLNCGKVNKLGVGVQNQYSGSSSNLLTFPNLLDGKMYVTRQYIQESSLSYIIRGVVPGFWYICHYIPYQVGDIVQGTVGTETEGRTFMYFSGYNNGGYFIEISDTWYV